VGSFLEQEIYSPVQSYHQQLVATCEMTAMSNYVSYVKLILMLALRMNTWCALSCQKCFQPTRFVKRCIRLFTYQSWGHVLYI